MKNFYTSNNTSVVLSFDKEYGGINLRVKGYNLSPVEWSVLTSPLGSKVGKVKDTYDREAKRWNFKEMELPEAGLGFTYRGDKHFFYIHYTDEAWEAVSKSPLLNNIVTEKPKALSKAEAKEYNALTAKWSEEQATKKANAPKRTTKSSKVAVLEAYIEQQNAKIDRMEAILAQFLNAQSEASAATPKRKPMAQKVSK